MNQVNSSKLSYRPEIDGLRAIAIVSVILYHAKMVLFGKNWFEGGFIGVDIFFVISGYLITRIILSELEIKGSFSFLNFYERRARRILPMLFVVIFVSIPYAWARLLPSAFVEYAQSILASLIFGSNFFFYFTTTEYGADSALLKPFLHTWSLGIEEQFYLVFPILAILAFKFLRRYFLIILIVLSLMSLQFANLMETQNADLNFYLPLSRFWELAVGSMLAYRELNYKLLYEGIAKRMLSLIGLCLVIYSILFFDHNTPHPSFHTLIPIIGVAFIIGFASRDEFVGKLLGSKPFVWIGLISYSAYLWHFPIFAFERISLKEISNLDKLVLIFIVFVLSVCSYFLIEQFFRNKKNLTRKSFVYYSLISFVIVVLSMFLIIRNEGFSDRLERVFSLSSKNYNNTIDNIRIYEGDGNVVTKKPKVIILGDSYTANWGVLGAYISDDFDVYNITYLGCQFVFTDDSVKLKSISGNNYHKRCDSTFAFLSKKESIKNVAAIILVSHRPFSYKINTFRFDAIKHIKKYSPSADVFVIGNYFQLDRTLINSCLNLIFQRGQSNAEVCRDYSTYYNPQLELKELLEKPIDSKDLEYKYVSVFETLRNDDGTYPYEYKGVPFVLDWNHMSKAMVELFSLNVSNYSGENTNILELKEFLKVAPAPGFEPGTK